MLSKWGRRKVSVRVGHSTHYMIKSTDECRLRVGGLTQFGYLYIITFSGCAWEMEQRGQDICGCLRAIMHGLSQGIAYIPALQALKDKPGFISACGLCCHVGWGKPVLAANSGTEMDTKDKDDKPVKEAEKSIKAPKPMPSQPRWPGLGGNPGAKKPNSVHSRMPTGRGSARGR